MKPETIQEIKRHTEEASEAELRGLAENTDYRTAKLVANAKRYVSSLTGEVEKLQKELEAEKAKVSRLEELRRFAVEHGERGILGHHKEWLQLMRLTAQEPEHYPDSINPFMQP